LRNSRAIVLPQRGQCSWVGARKGFAVHKSFEVDEYLVKMDR